MSLKVINITVPFDSIMPDILSSFSPDENYMMLKIGSETLSEGRKVVANLTSDEIFKKVRNDFEKEIEKLNLEITTERKTSLAMNEKISIMYETQMEQLNKKFENALSQIEIYKQGNSISLQDEITKVKEKCELLLEEKDRQNKLNRETFDKAVKLLDNKNNKSSISLGDSGEQIFENLSDTFKDYPEFKIENKAKQSHKGDFHLFFQKFNILVDSKNYTSVISKKEIQKIESDLNTNGNMNFAWLVSLNTNICEYNKYPITPKWITTDDGKIKCILMINSLLNNKDPRNVLRQALQICEDFYRLTRDVKSEDGELERYRENNLIYNKRINNLQEQTSDLRRSMNTSFNILKNMDKDLLDMLTNISDDMVNDKFSMLEKMKEWWNNNIVTSLNKNDKIVSTELWNKFKKENKNYIGENNVTIEKFKDTLTGNIVNSSNYIEKNKKGAIEFIGFKWKIIEEKEINILDNLELDNSVIENSKNKKH